MKPQLAIDFDATIAQYNEQGFLESSTGLPIDGAIDFIKALSTKFEIVIFSARGGTERGKKAIWDWLKLNGIRNLIRDVTNVKSYEFVAFIDDRAITYTCPSDYRTIAKGLGVEL